VTSDKGESGGCAGSTCSWWFDGSIELAGEVVEVVEIEGVYGRLGSALLLASGRGAAGGSADDSLRMRKGMRRRVK